MDKIIIENLKIFAHHGVFGFEKNNGQYFLISCVMETSTRTAGKNDDLNNTINYAHICELINNITCNNTFDLLETLAEKICEEILLKYDTIKSVDITIKKPDAPIFIDNESVGISIKRQKHTAFLSIGSNMGEREKYIDFAISSLNDNPFTKVIKTAKYIETEPYGYTEQQKFINTCCEIETLLYPEELLNLTSEIEKNAERKREIHWGPRTLDIDIIFYDEIMMSTPKLTIPHIDMENRFFVLAPLCEIAPYAVHPVYRKTIKELLKTVTQK